MIKYNGKSPGGLCLDYIELYKHTVGRAGLIAGGQWIRAIDTTENPERFYFIKDTAEPIEREITVDGVKMYEVLLPMLVAGDDETRISALEKHKRKKYLIRYTDRNHIDKIMGHPTGAYCSLIIEERRGGRIRSDRKDIAVTWRCVLPEPMAVYKL